MALFAARARRTAVCNLPNPVVLLLVVALDVGRHALAVGFAAALERALHTGGPALRAASRARAEELPAERMFRSLRAVLEEAGK